MTGIFCDIWCFSFYPFNNLGAFGNVSEIYILRNAKCVKIFSNYGSEQHNYKKVVGAYTNESDLDLPNLWDILNFARSSEDICSIK